LLSQHVILQTSPNIKFGRPLGRAGQGRAGPGFRPDPLFVQLDRACSQSGLTINRTGPHRTVPDRTSPPGAPHRTTPDRTGQFGAFSELLTIRVLQLAPY